MVHHILLILGKIINGFGRQETETHQVSVKDGYAYVSNGIEIVMEYTGLPLSKNSVLVPGAGPDYGTILGGYYKPASNLDKEYARRFPYQNDIPSGKYWWLQKSKPSLSDFTNLTNIRNKRSRTDFSNI